MNGHQAGSLNQHYQRFALLQGFGRRLALGLLIMLLTVVIQLSYPKALAYFIDNIQLQQDSSWYSTFAIAMLVLLSVQAVATAMRYYCFESTGYMVVSKIRQLVYNAILRQPIRFYDKHNVGELTNRLSADVEILHDTLTMGLAISLRAALTFVGGVIMLLLISPALSVMLVVFVPLSLYLGRWVGRRITQRATAVQQQQALCGKVAHEHFTNIRLVHAFNQQASAKKAYASATNSALQVSVACVRFFAYFHGITSFLTYMALLITLWFGATLISSGSLSIGELTSFIIYAAMVTNAAAAIGDFWTEWMRTIGATDRVFEIIASAPSDEPQSATHPALTGNISFDNVSFSYPERSTQLALNRVSFNVIAGEIVALVGSSGAGKSTIASMILGFYMADKGRISFDNISMQPENVSHLRENIAIVEQEPSLFSGTIFENIAFAVAGKDVSSDDVIRAAKLANADEFIQSFAAGYQTVVGDRGVQLSGGQKQRIAIARALLRDPKILILDEATSALDSASEAKVQQALSTLMAGRTTFIIAHRYSTIVEADRILVLSDGCVVQQGSHTELMQQQHGLYFHLMANQLTQTDTIDTKPLIASAR
ncbi:ABC transporter ATP-binding protein [Rheinheimera sp. EpRS3]|uniref:ABC transporter ATP-binding protein n=1 Tax=Rheinheimera sp. EpRS3 TaxID=1712383 RepID=UPI000A6FE02B|nr:ABC transporter ATP-binding protein [Rheinheimera sp. EpRS3]